MTQLQETILKLSNAMTCLEYGLITQAQFDEIWNTFKCKGYL